MVLLINRAEEQRITQNQLALLNAVLCEEFSYVDREALGHCCGLSMRWWEPAAGLLRESYYRLLYQLHYNEVPNIALRVAIG